jgi:hypothetical protein
MPCPSSVESQLDHEHKESSSLHLEILSTATTILYEKLQGK